MDGARLSSGFGARLHPILGYTRMHKGIDFAVPIGTPVMAAGDGTILFAGSGGEYGNLVVIKHGNSYATAYGHLSRFASGVRNGARVRQGDVVAYSGMTGLATGPHLHYEIRLNNIQVNPLTVKVASGRRLEGEDLKTFIAERGHIETLEASLPIEHRLAQASGMRNRGIEHPFHSGQSGKSGFLPRILDARTRGRENVVLRQCTAWLGGSELPIRPRGSPDVSTSRPLMMSPRFPAETFTLSPSDISPSRIRSGPSGS